MKERFSIKFGGHSGQGINMLGGFLSKALRDLGYAIFANREYPSIIKGGYASYKIDFSSSEILSPSKKTNVLACISLEALDEYLCTVSKNGIVIHSVNDFRLTRENARYIQENNIKILFLETSLITQKEQASLIMGNIVLLGAVWKILNADLSILEKIVVDYFSQKEGIDIEAEKRCLRAGYNFDGINNLSVKSLPKIVNTKWNESIVLTGNHGIALGAIAAGCRAYYAYPMTPATSILEILGDTYQKTHIVVKQAESEITAIQMVMGSMYMGARAFTATSGGGFDLMTESISCSGTTEIPLVVVLGQRAGSGTGVPTWSGASDLAVALHSGHGEFPRCVLCASDPIDCFELIQDAFNISEKYQIPVILLTEKQIAESIFNISKLPSSKRIKRGIVQNGLKRYILTKSGISPRWLPKVGNKTYLTNSDEHNEYGISTEQEDDIVNMSEKRMRKIISLKNEIPEPKYYGPESANIVFVGMGSTKNAVLDAMKISKKSVGYLHYKYIYPLSYGKIFKLSKKGVKLVLIENNQSSGFGKLIKEQSSFYISNTLNKFDGRPFFVDDILEYLKQ